MTETLKILGQNKPAGTTLTDLYTVPAATSTSVSSIICCNESTADTFRISVALGGAVDNAKQYLYYDLPIIDNDTFIATIGISLSTTDVIRVYSGLGNVAFSVFGVEVT